MVDQVAVSIIRIYQRILSPLLPPVCRFYPSCSEYTARAIKSYGIWIGLIKGIKRLSKCHPFNEGGYDPLEE